MSTDPNTAAATAAEYAHTDKFIEPDETIILGPSRLKWHNLAKHEDGVPAGVRDLARDFLGRESAAGKLSQLGDLGFVILHRCGQDFYFLLVNSWRNDNEVWESVYAKQTSEQADFEEFASAGLHHPVFCVWELAAVWHEQQAWRRYLLSPRGDGDRETYIKDRYRGPA